MNWPFFVAQKLAARRQKSFSTAIIRLAVLAVGLSSAVMILALASVSGFQTGIKNKVLGVNGHIVVDDISNTEGAEPLPLPLSRENFTNDIRAISGVKSVSLVAIRPCIARGELEIDGMLARGVASNTDLSFFKENLLSGFIPDFAKDSNTALISSVTATRLGLKVGDRIQAIFFKEDSAGGKRPRAINPKICGIFSTGLEEYDKTLVITHISQIRKMMPKGTSFTQWEIRTDDFSKSEKVAEAIALKLPPGIFNINTAKRYNRQIFDWLALLDTNVVIILSLMLLVAGIGMCTTLLILVTERTSMIGTLKALGADNGGIRQIFIFQVVFIVGLGLILGNVLGLGLALLQDKFGFIRLNTETYYVNRVLIELNPLHLLLVNVGTILLCFVVLYLPAKVIGRLSPVKTMRFQ
jgi:lipoprotein-releasing system permease protein